MGLSKHKAQPLPFPPSEYSAGYLKNLVRTLELYFGFLDSNTPNYAESYTADFFKGGAYYVSVNALAADATLTTTDSFVPVDATSGAVTVTLPAASESAGQVMIVKKIDASANTVTIDGNGSETIDDAATAVITTQYEVSRIVCDGTEWWTV